MYAEALKIACRASIREVSCKRSSSRVEIEFLQNGAGLVVACGGGLWPREAVGLKQFQDERSRETKTEIPRLGFPAHDHPNTPLRLLRAGSSRRAGDTGYKNAREALPSSG